MCEPANDLNKLFERYNNKEMINNIPEYQLIDLNFIKYVSKNISEILLNQNCSRRTKQTTIELLSSLTCPESHFKITETYLDIFIKSFIDDPTFGTNSTIIPENDQLNVEKLDRWEDICGVIRQKYQKHLETRIKSGYLQMFTVKQFEKLNFPFNAPTKSFQNKDAEQMLDYFQDLKVQSVDEASRDLTSDKIEVKSDEKIKIELALVLLHIKDDNRLKLFDQLMDDLARNKSEDVIKFVEYLWTNYDTYPREIYSKILSNFEHLYERPLLHLYTIYLENPEDISIIHNENIQKLFEIINSDLKLGAKVTQCLNKLLELSNMDGKVKKLHDLLLNTYCSNNC